MALELTVVDGVEPPAGTVRLPGDAMGSLGVAPGGVATVDGRRRTAARVGDPLESAFGLAVSAVGLALLGRPGTYYLGAILAWAGPVLAVQWAFDWPYLWARRRTVALGVLVPTAYPPLVDGVAISRGIWELSPAYTTGLALGGLPVEEAAFFLVTNTFVVQGLVLFRGLAERLPLGTAGGAGDRRRETVDG